MRQRRRAQGQVALRCETVLRSLTPGIFSTVSSGTMWHAVCNRYLAVKVCVCVCVCVCTRARARVDVRVFDFVCVCVLNALRKSKRHF